MSSRKSNVKLVVKNRKLKARVEALEEVVDQIHKHDHENGEHLKRVPFIPEYLGFVETVHKEVDSSAVKVRIYTRDGYNIAKSVGTNRNEWAILDPHGVKNSLLIENMNIGISILRACGMQISMYDYNQQNRKMEKEIADNIQLILEQEKELEED